MERDRQHNLCLVVVLTLATIYSCSGSSSSANLQNVPRGRIRIVDVQLSNLQKQFPPPPQAPGPTLTRAHIPLLRDEVKKTPLEKNFMQDSVVYGNWESNEQQQQPETVKLPKKRVYGRLEAMLMGLPPEQIIFQQQTQLNENDRFDNTRSSLEQSFGRFPLPPRNPVPPVKGEAKQAKPISIESMETTTSSWIPVTYHGYHGSHEIETLRARAPSSTSARTTLPVVAIPTPLATLPVSTTTTERQMETDVESTSESLSWPTDFLESVSTESIGHFDDDSLDLTDDYKYYENGDRSSAQTRNDLSMPEMPMVSQLPVNITRIGIPYEDRSASSEPTLCVPLTVTERSVASNSARPVVVEVERVYCFPLPKVEMKSGNPPIRILNATQYEDFPTELLQSNRIPNSRAPQQSINGALLLLTIICQITLGWT